MNNSVTYNYIYKTLTKELGIKKELINDSSVFCNDLGLNDTELSILLFYIESHFNIDVPSEEITPKTTVCDLTKLVQKIKTNGNATLAFLPGI